MIRFKGGRFVAAGLFTFVVLAATASAQAFPELGVGSASAGVQQTAVVSTTPAANTPNLLPDGRDASGHAIKGEATYALEQSPDAQTMYVGGQFVGVENAARTAQYPRSNFMAFSIASGAVLTLAPSFNGSVWAIRASADGASLYVGGEFSSVTVNGVTTFRRGLAKINLVSGTVDPKWKPAWASGKVHDLQLVGGRVIAGGTFAKHLEALDTTTGADTGYISLPISGTCVNNAACETSGSASTAQPTDVYRFAVNSAGTRLVAIGNFDMPHPRAFMVDLDATAATLDSWYYQAFSHTCILPQTYPAYLRDVDFSPDGSYFVIVATGYVVKDPTRRNVDVCDAAARFNTAALAPYLPQWINYTGGDTMHSTVVTGAAVYVQGHFRYLDNPDGRDSCVTTCVSRAGIGAIDPDTGRALSWNPGKTRGVGGKDLLSTGSGVWVGSDGATFNNKYHYGLAFVPLP